MSSFNPPSPSKQLRFNHTALYNVVVIIIIIIIKKIIIIIIIIIIKENINVITHSHYLQKGEITSKNLTSYTFVT